jgi:perosamine synthetase
MNIRKNIPLFKVFMSPTVKQAVNDVLFSGYIGEGAKVIEFEEQLSNLLTNSKLLSTNSGTSALHLAYHMALYPETKQYGNIDQQAEIITTPITCTATNTPILNHGAKIVWADVDPITGNIDPQDIRQKITNKTKAITMVHWGGNPCDIDAIKQIAAEHNIKVIEDAAHSLGSLYKNQPIGTHSDYTAFSFQAIKHLTTVDGGCLAVNNDDDYKRGKLLRWYGIDREVKEGVDLRCELDVSEAGYKFHMNDVAATIGLENLRTIDELLNKHRDNADYYNTVFADRQNITITPHNNDSSPAYWLYTIHVNNRDEFMQNMLNSGITVSKVHARNDTHSMFKSFQCNLPNADKFNNSHICIPVGWWLTKEDREYIADKAIKYA